MDKKFPSEKAGAAVSSLISPKFSQLLRTLEEQVDGLYEQSSFGTFLTDDAGRCLSINSQALKWIGCTRESILGKIFPGEPDAAQNWEKLRQWGAQLDTQHAPDGELELTNALGERRQFKVYSQPIPVSENNLSARRAVFYDVTYYNRLRQRERIAAIAFESKMGICVFDKNDMVLEVNEAFAKITGYATKDLRGKRYDLFFAGDEKNDAKAAILRTLDVRGVWEGEVAGRRSDGSSFVVWMNISSVPMREESAEYYVICLYDITQSKAAQNEIHNLAYFDSLTKLPNRRKLNDRLKRDLSIISRSQLHGAVLFVDLDNFKSLNDTKGHSVGDLLLIEVGQRLQKAVREGDMVARVGGDEFVVVLDDLSVNIDEASYQASLVGSKIQEMLTIPFVIEDFVFNCGGSIGISIFGQHDLAEDIIQQADMAMYRAKRQGRNSLCFFDPAMKKAASDYLHLEQELGHAIELGQLQLFYQPQFNYQGHIVGVEALLRWQHPVRGLVVPDDFIPLAEESGLILPIGLWVLESACRQINQWQSDPMLARLQVAINVSPRQFKDQNFVANVTAIIADSGVKASQLKFELTESMIHDVEVIRDKMENIRQLGVQFSLDDFGTGYSSLVSLIKLPLEQLKIDRSFISNMLSNDGDRIVVRTIISMASNLGIEVIAEGLETESERYFLNSLGCSLYQGYLLSPPLPCDAAVDLIKSVNSSIAKVHANAQPM